MAQQYDLQLFFGVSWSQQFTLAPVIDITNFTWAFSIRDKFQGVLLLQVTSGAGIVTNSGPLALWTVSLTKAQLTNWIAPPSGSTSTLIQKGQFFWDMQRIDAGFEDVTHTGNLYMKPSYRVAS